MQYLRCNYYNWMSKYGGMENSDTRKLKGLEDKNHSLEHEALKYVVKNKL